MKKTNHLFILILVIFIFLSCDNNSSEVDNEITFFPELLKYDNVSRSLATLNLEEITSDALLYTLFAPPLTGWKTGNYVKGQIYEEQIYGKSTKVTATQNDDGSIEFYGIHADEEGYFKIIINGENFTFEQKYAFLLAQDATDTNPDYVYVVTQFEGVRINNKDFDGTGLTQIYMRNPEYVGDIQNGKYSIRKRSSGSNVWIGLNIFEVGDPVIPEGEEKNLPVADYDVSDEVLEQILEWTEFQPNQQCIIYDSEYGYSSLYEESEITAAFAAHP